MKLISTFTCLALLSCAGSKEPEKKEEGEEEKIPESRVVGRIASVSPHSGFVLIQKYGAGRLPTDGIYQTIGDDGRVASIRPSGERIRDFYAADITSGKIESGDVVIFRTMGPEKTEDSADLENEETKSTETKEESPQ